MIFDCTDEKAVELNNALNKTQNILTSEQVTINKQNILVGSLYHNNVLILKMDYVILGTYKIEQNTWIWATKSITLNKTNIMYNIQYREYCYSNNNCKEITNFIKNEFSVLSLTEFNNNICLLASTIYTWKQQYLISIKRNRGIDIFVVKKLLYESLLV